MWQSLPSFHAALFGFMQAWCISFAIKEKENEAVSLNLKASGEEKRGIEGREGRRKGEKEEEGGGTCQLPSVLPGVLSGQDTLLQSVGQVSGSGFKQL